jgi:hypothetical protein
MWDDGRNSWSETWSKSGSENGKSVPGESDSMKGEYDPKKTGPQVNNPPQVGEAPRLPRLVVPQTKWNPPPYKPLTSKYLYEPIAHNDEETGKKFSGDFFAGNPGLRNPTTLSRFEALNRLALLILQASYGRYSDRFIQPGVLNVTDSKGILDAMDRANNWSSGTAQKKYGNLYGIAHQGRVFINTDLNTDDLTILKTMVHEMLHINQHRSLTTTVGQNLMEGLTQHLAMEAFRATGRLWDDAGGYKDQVRVVIGLERLLGPQILREVYFNNPSLLAKEFNLVAGFNLFGTFLKLVEQGKFNDAISILPF